MKAVIRVMMIAVLVFSGFATSYAQGDYAGIGEAVGKKAEDSARDIVIGAAVLTGITWFIIHKVRKNRKKKRMAKTSKKKFTDKVQVGFVVGGNKNQAWEGAAHRPTISSTNQKHRDLFF